MLNCGTHLSGLVWSGDTMLGKNRHSSIVRPFANMPAANGTTINFPLVKLTTLLQQLYEDSLSNRRPADVTWNEEPPNLISHMLVQGVKDLITHVYRL